MVAGIGTEHSLIAHMPFRCLDDRNEEFLFSAGAVSLRLHNDLMFLVNRRDPGFITSQVDTIAGTMSQTERTMSELQFLTGLDGKEESAPAIVSREVQ